MHTVKTATISALCVFSVWTMAENAMAQNAPASATQANGPQAHNNDMAHYAAAGKSNPGCKNLLDACKKAGFVKGGAKEGNGLFVDCFAHLVDGKGNPPTLKGQAVNISVEQNDVQACHAAVSGAQAAPAAAGK